MQYLKVRIYYERSESEILLDGVILMSKTFDGERKQIPIYKEEFSSEINSTEWKLVNYVTSIAVYLGDYHYLQVYSIIMLRFFI